MTTLTPFALTPPATQVSTPRPQANFGGWVIELQRTSMPFEQMQAALTSAKEALRQQCGLKTESSFVTPRLMRLPDQVGDVYLVNQSEFADIPEKKATNQLQSLLAQHLHIPVTVVVGHVPEAKMGNKQIQLQKAGYEVIA